MRWRNFCAQALVLSLTVVAFTTLAAQDDTYAPKAGDVRIGGEGLGALRASAGGVGATRIDLDIIKNTAINLGLDYFLNESFAFNLLFSWSEFESGGETERSTTWGVGIGYFFAPSSDSNVLPFIRATYRSIDFFGLTPTGFSVTGGAHIFLNPNASVDIFVSYLNLRESGVTVDGFTIGVGLSFWFR